MGVQEMGVQAAGTHGEDGGRAERWWPGLGAEQGGADSPRAQPQPSPSHLQAFTDERGTQPLEATGTAGRDPRPDQKPLWVNQRLPGPEPGREEPSSQTPWVPLRPCPSGPQPQEAALPCWPAAAQPRGVALGGSKGTNTGT